ncbi:MAG: sigma-54 dependent transcriptional regulator [Zavarzinella sp.]
MSQQSPKAAIIDDDDNIRYSLAKTLGNLQIETETADCATAGIELVRRMRPDLVLIDVCLPDKSGLDAFTEIHEFDPLLPVIIMTAYDTTDTTIEAMKRGAFDYMLKPVDLQSLRELVKKALALRKMQSVPASFQVGPGETKVDEIVGRSPEMQEIYKLIGKFAPQNVAVLIQGESGTGKELVARALYHHSNRANKPFIAVNCAAIPDSLLESELFGHERGAFTGADRQRIGKFEQAHGGTIFLDEIGDMSPMTQAKVLRVLQDFQFERVGGNTQIFTDTRVIAATNHDLQEKAQEGKFRQDLLYRLNGFTITLPPLRERKSDIRPLVDHFIKLSNEKLGKSIKSIADDALQALFNWDWPGNVRELQGAIRYGAVQAVGSMITVECLPALIRGFPDQPESEYDSSHLVQETKRLLQAGQSDIYRHLLNMFDRTVLSIVLDHVDGNQVSAAEILGISRTTLRHKLASIDKVEDKVLQD